MLVWNGSLLQSGDVALHEAQAASSLKAALNFKGTDTWRHFSRMFRYVMTFSSLGWYINHIVSKWAIYCMQWMVLWYAPFYNYSQYSQNLLEVLWTCIHKANSCAAKHKKRSKPLSDHWWRYLAPCTLRSCCHRSSLSHSPKLQVESDWLT